MEEAAVQQQVAGMVFLELMFWKNQKEAEDVREEYNWKVSGPHLLHRYSPPVELPSAARQDASKRLHHVDPQSIYNCLCNLA